MAAPAGKDVPFDLVPCRFASRLASLWAKQHHHPIGPRTKGIAATRQPAAPREASAPQWRSATARGVVAWPAAQPPGPTPIPPVDSPPLRLPSPATWLREQTAQRPPRHSPGAGAQRWSADGGAIPGLHPWEPPGVSRTPGATVRPGVATEKSNKADDLALHKAFTAQAGPALRAVGPRRRATGAFGQPRFD
jgi:hypothetical protein